MPKFQTNDIIFTDMAGTFIRYCVLGHSPMTTPAAYTLNRIDDTGGLYSRVRSNLYLDSGYVDIYYQLDTSLILSAAGNPIPTPVLPAGAGTIMPQSFRAAAWKFEIGDLLKDKDSNSSFRYKVIRRNVDNIWGSPTGEYILERLETDDLPAHMHYLSQDFCEQNFEAVLIGGMAKGGCTHDWAVYDSGFRSFEYCKKCNIEKAGVK